MKDRLKSIEGAAVLSTTAFILVAASTTGTLQARESSLGRCGGPNPSSQALAFVPNELWIHTNDSVRCEPDNKGLNAFGQRMPALQSNNVFRAYRYSEEEVVRAR